MMEEFESISKFGVSVCNLGSLWELGVEAVSWASMGTKMMVRSLETKKDLNFWATMSTKVTVKFWTKYVCLYKTKKWK